ncbi:MAG: hypothetical protein JWR08_2537 [Enterovirga sp.]|nr:hypothetical protein [Enterovirga sp.]
MTLSWLLFSFQGRISRKPYWLAVAVFIAVQIVASLLDLILSGSANGILSMVASLVVLVASIAVSVKRWHDRDKSGWWYLIIFVPLIGWVWSVVENGFLRGTEGPNRFGPDPLAPPPFGAQPFGAPRI